MKGFYQKASGILDEIIQEEFGQRLSPPLWEVPARQEFGDLSSMAAMKLASRLKKDPLEVAGQLKSILLKRLGPELAKVEILKPAFINIFISKDTLITSLNDLLRRKDKFFRHKLGKKILIEFVSANPTGPLSIAHGRQAVVGGVIANILEFFGNKVTRQYYINDAGRQTDLLVESVQARMQELQGQPLSLPQGGYQGTYLKEVASLCLAKDPKNLRSFVLRRMLTVIKKDLASLGVGFDSWISQQKLIDDGLVDKAIAALKDEGFIYNKEQATWFLSSKFGDDKDRVIKKADGELTYFASDIAFHQGKAAGNFDRLINLWGPDHHGYIPRVKAALKAQGFSPELLDIIIIQLVSIKTRERMSRRQGTAVLLSDLLGDVGKDAARFYYLTRRNSSHLEFDIDLACQKSFSNLLYYIQYACARIESIFRKAKVKKFSASNTKFLKEEDDFNLLRVLLQFFYCLEKACFCLEPVFIIEYLKSLAAVLHGFYERQRVLSDDLDLTRARLNLLQATRIVLHCALNILGITPAKRL